MMMHEVVVVSCQRNFLLLHHKSQESWCSTSCCASSKLKHARPTPACPSRTYTIALLAPHPGGQVQVESDSDPLALPRMAIVSRPSTRRQGSASCWAAAAVLLCLLLLSCLAPTVDAQVRRDFCLDVCVRMVRGAVCGFGGMSGAWSSWGGRKRDVHVPPCGLPSDTHSHGRAGVRMRNMANRSIQLTPPFPCTQRKKQWGMKKKDQKKDGAVRPEDVPGGKFMSQKSELSFGGLAAGVID